MAAVRSRTKADQDVPAPVIKAAFTLMNTGDVSGVIDAGSGQYYILKQTGRRKQMTKSFDDAKPQIRNKLFREKRLKAQQDFIDGLRAKAKVDINEANLAKVRIDTSQNTAGDDGHGHDLAVPADPASGSDIQPPPPPAGSGASAGQPNP